MRITQRCLIIGLLALMCSTFAGAATVTGRVRDANTNSFLLGYLTAIGATADGDVFQREREILDAKVSYRLNKRLKLFADVINLRQEPLEEYIGQPYRGTATEKYWWTATFGVNWSL